MKDSATFPSYLSLNARRYDRSFHTFKTLKPSKFERIGISTNGDLFPSDHVGIVITYDILY